MASRTRSSQTGWRQLATVAAAMGVAGSLFLVSDYAPNASAVRQIESRGDVALRPSDSTDVVAVVTGYHAAMAAGDSAAAPALLASDAIILESGGVETREEYRSGHLRGDIGFAQGIKSERGPVRVVIQGDVPWAASFIAIFRTIPSTTTSRFRELEG